MAVVAREAIVSPSRDSSVTRGPALLSAHAVNYPGSHKRIRYRLLGHARLLHSRLAGLLVLERQPQAQKRYRDFLCQTLLAPESSRSRKVKTEEIEHLSNCPDRT